MSATITDWGTAIIASLATALALVFAFVPRLIGFLVILLIGWIVATAVAKAITFLLRKVGFDRVATRIGLTRLEQRMNIHMDAAALLGRIGYWFVFLIFLIPAVDALGLTSISTLLDQVISYLPNVFVAIIILLLGVLLATFLADVVEGALSNSQLSNRKIVANIVRYGCILFVALLALFQLQIAPAMIQTLFTAIVGAMALALALAFGLGGRETAKRYLERSAASLAPAGGPALTSSMNGSPTISSSNPASTTPETDPGLNAMRGRLQPLPEQNRPSEQNPYRRPVTDR